MRKFALAAVLSLTPATLPAQIVEGLENAPLPGFELGYQAHDGAASMYEYVPNGETVQDWTRMVTFNSMPGFAQQGVTAPFFMTRMRESLARVCTGATVDYYREFAYDGASAVAMRSHCPSNPMTGSPEITFFRAMNDGEDLHIVQVAYRYEPDDDEAAWAEDYLGTVHLCEGSCE